MGLLVLNNQNKAALRDYYINLYVIELKEKGIYKESMYQEIIDNVDTMIKKYQKQGGITTSFPKYMGGYNPLKKKYNLRLMGINEKVKLIKNGETRYKETLIDYYKNLFKLNLLLQNKSMSKNNEILEEGYKVIEDCINNYFDNNLDSKFVVYMAYRLNSFYFRNNIKTHSKEKNIIIDNKEGNEKQRKELYDKYYRLTIKAIKNTSKLPEEKFELLLREIVIKKVDDYFDGENKGSTLRNYFQSFLTRLDGQKDQMLVKYNFFFNDFYDESIAILEEYVKNFINKYIKENKISEIKLIFRLKNNSKKIAKDYLDMCIKSKRCTPFDVVIASRINKIIDQKPNTIGFEPQNVINGDAFDKENEKEILKEQLLELKDIVKEKYTFYIDEKSVDARIDKDYNKIIESYIKNMYLTKKIPTGKPAFSYVSTRLKQNVKTYANTTRKNFEKNKVERKLCFEYFNIVNNYIEEKEFSEEEIELFFEYMGNAFETYVKNGTYKKELWLYLKELIDNYDSLVAKDIIEAKTYIDSKVKVLKHPKTK